jgi:hypothetical protein
MPIWQNSVQYAKEAFLFFFISNANKQMKASTKR